MTSLKDLIHSIVMCASWDNEFQSSVSEDGHCMKDCQEEGEQFLKKLKEHIETLEPQPISSDEYATGFREGWTCAKIQTFKFLKGEKTKT